MRPILRSVLRILLATLASLALLFSLAAAAITQPAFGTLPALDGPRADPAKLRKHVEFLTITVSPRDAGHPENLERAAAYLRDHFSKTGARVREQAFNVRGRIYRNVIASFGPETGPVLIVGAHYDSFGDFGINPGADDNASGTAGLLELARLLDGHPLDRQLDLVAYANEEPPYFGSSWMGSAVHARSLQGQDVQGMICLEMIGYFTERQPAPNWLFRLLYPDRGDFIAVAGRWADRGLTRRVKRALRGTLPAVSFTAPRSAGLDGSDQINYWDLGIPAVMVTDTSFVRNPHYHTPGIRRRRSTMGGWRGWWMGYSTRCGRVRLNRGAVSSAMPVAPPTQTGHASTTMNGDRIRRQEDWRERPGRRSPESGAGPRRDPQSCRTSSPGQGSGPDPPTLRRAASTRRGGWRPVPGLSWRDS